MFVLMSEHWARVKYEADKFYKNGCAFVDDAHWERHQRAARAFEEERYLAGYDVSHRGVRIILKEKT